MTHLIHNVHTQDKTRQIDYYSCYLLSRRKDQERRTLTLRGWGDCAEDAGPAMLGMNVCQRIHKRLAL